MNQKNAKVNPPPQIFLKFNSLAAGLRYIRTSNLA